MDEYILNVKGLVKKYRRFSLKNISFNIPRGYIMGFVGRNGAGKSTTIKCIMDLVQYDEGLIEVFGLDSRENVREIRQRVGYVSEEHYFYEDMSVEWTGNFIGKFYPNWDAGLFNELLKKFEIIKRKKVSELSKGMKMKLSLALALGHSPELLILDEPTSGLDPVIRSELLDMFLDIIQDENRSVFFSSHITSDIEKVADFVTIINDGHIIMSDRKDKILDEWSIIKAENKYFNKELHKALIGVKKGEFGFSGMTDSIDEFSERFKQLYPGGGFKTEKITLDELLVRIAKDGEKAC